MAYHINCYMPELGSETSGMSCSFDELQDALNELSTSLAWLRKGQKIVITLEDEDNG